MKSKFTLIAMMGLTTAMPGFARDFLAPNKMDVTATGNGSFTVSGNARLGARSYWCAAGDYARRVEQMKLQDRLFVVKPMTGNTGPVGFSRSPGNYEERRFLSLASTMKNAGAYISVGQASGYCRDYFEDLRSSR